MFHVPEKYRYAAGYFNSDSSFGNNGAFYIPHYKIASTGIFVIASDGLDWDHVSVSIIPDKGPTKRTPTWSEMCFVKNMFWDKTDPVLQFHPPESQYINNHEFCLHLWRPQLTPVILPDPSLIGIKHFNHSNVGI